MRKRLWRIVPAYYVAVVVFGLHFWISPFEWSGQRQYLTHVLFIHNWFPDTFFGINGPFWSLASEVQFYLAYPLVVLLRTRIGMGWILFGATALSFVSRSVFSFWFDCEYPITPLWTSFPVLWVDWLLGSWVAERFREGKMAFPGFWWLPASLTAFVLAGLWKPTNCLSFSLSSLVWAVILDRVIRPDWQPRLVGRFLVHLGLISYSMYLWHHPLMEEIYPRLNIHRERFPLPGELISVLFFFIVWTLIYIVSVMSFRWVEDPSWLWKRQVKQP